MRVLAPRRLRDLGAELAVVARPVDGAGLRDHQRRPGGLPPHRHPVRHVLGGVVVAEEVTVRSLVGLVHDLAAGVAEDADRGDVDDPSHPGGDGRVEDDDRAVHIGLEHRLVLRLPDADPVVSGDVEHEVDAGEQLVERARVRDTAAHGNGAEAGQRRRRRLRARQTDDVVAAVDQAADDRRAEEPCTTCHETLHRRVPTRSTRARRVPVWPAIGSFLRSSRRCTIVAAMHHARATLREQGYRLTPQRNLIWEVLRDAGRHMTAEEVAAEARRTMPDVNVSTVYRTLELLVSLDLVVGDPAGGQRLLLRGLAGAHPPPLRLHAVRDGGALRRRAAGAGVRRARPAPGLRRRPDPGDGVRPLQCVPGQRGRRRRARGVHGHAPQPRPCGSAPRHHDPGRDAHPRRLPRAADLRRPVARDAAHLGGRSAQGQADAEDQADPAARPRERRSPSSS